MIAFWAMILMTICVVTLCIIASVSARREADKYSAKDVVRTKSELSGEIEPLDEMQELEQQLSFAVENEDYERAAKIRDKLKTKKTNVTA